MNYIHETKNLKIQPRTQVFADSFGSAIALIVPAAAGGENNKSSGISASLAVISGDGNVDNKKGFNHKKSSGDKTCDTVRTEQTSRGVIARTSNRLARFRMP